MIEGRDMAAFQKLCMDYSDIAAVAISYTKVMRSQEMLTLGNALLIVTESLAKDYRIMADNFAEHLRYQPTPQVVIRDRTE